MPVEKQSLETRAEDLENIENETEESLHLLQQEVLQQNENPEYQKYLIPEKEYLTKLQDMLTQSWISTTDIEPIIADCATFAKKCNELIILHLDGKSDTPEAKELAKIVETQSQLYFNQRSEAANQGRGTRLTIAHLRYKFYEGVWNAARFTLEYSQEKKLEDIKSWMPEYMERVSKERHDKFLARIREKVESGLIDIFGDITQQSSVMMDAMSLYTCNGKNYTPHDTAIQMEKNTKKNFTYAEEEHSKKLSIFLDKLDESLTQEEKDIGIELSNRFEMSVRTKNMPISRESFQTNAYEPFATQFYRN